MQKVVTDAQPEWQLAEIRLQPISCKWQSIAIVSNQIRFEQRLGILGSERE